MSLHEILRIMLHRCSSLYNEG